MSFSARVAASKTVRAVLDRPAATVIGIGVFTLFMGGGLALLEIRTDGGAIHPTESPIVEQTQADRVTFHDGEQAILLLTSKPDGPPVESRQGFRTLKDLHDSLRSIPSVDERRVRSLATLLDARPEVPLLYIREFLYEIPQDELEYAALLERIHDFPLAQGVFLSPDGTAAALYVLLDKDYDRDELVTALESWIAQRSLRDYDLRLTGPAAAEVMLGRMVLRDLAWLVPIMVAVIACLLFFALGTPGGVLVPMAEVVMVLVWTLGAMGYCGVPVTLVTTILPIVLMTMAVTDEIHLLERLQRHLRADSAPGELAPRARVRGAIEAALRDVGRPIVLTSVTTSIGFLSFLTASIRPIQHFGLFTALGILLAMVLSFTFIPALVLLLPVSWFEGRSSPSGKAEAPALLAHERFVVRRTGLSALLGVLILLIGAPGLLRLTVQDSWIDNFDPQSALVSAERDFNAHFWGSYRFDVTFSSDVLLGFFHRTDGVRLMEDFREVALAGPGVGGIASYLIPLEVVAKVEGERGKLSTLPSKTLRRFNRSVQWLTHRIDLDQFLQWRGASARARLFVNSPNYLSAKALQDYLEREIPLLLQDPDLDYHFSGDLPLAVEVVRAVVTNQLRSMGWTLAGIAALLLLLTRSIRDTAVVMLPVATAIPILLGGMAYAGVPLGIATSMFTALTIGVGVDFAIHLFHAYRRERDAGHPHQMALEGMMQSTGKAIRWNASVLAVGFLVLTLSGMKPNQSLGVLLCAAMLVCYATSLLFLPRLLR